MGLNSLVFCANAMQFITTNKDKNYMNFSNLAEIPKRASNGGETNPNVTGTGPLVGKYILILYSIIYNTVSLISEQI